MHGKIERAIAGGQLKIVRGRIDAIEQQPARDGLRVSIRHGHGTRTLDVARVVNCTGPEAHPGRTSNPLLQGLIGDNVGHCDSLGMGLAVVRRLLHDHAGQPTSASRAEAVTIAPWAAGSQFQSTSVSR